MFSNASVLEWMVIAISIVMVPTIIELNHCKSKQNGDHFVRIFNGFGQNGYHFVLILHGFRQNGSHFVQNGAPLENRRGLT